MRTNFHDLLLFIKINFTDESLPSEAGEELARTRRVRSTAAGM